MDAQSVSGSVLYEDCSLASEAFGASASEKGFCWQPPHSTFLFKPRGREASCRLIHDQMRPISVSTVSVAPQPFLPHPSCLALDRDGRPTWRRHCASVLQRQQRRQAVQLLSSGYTGGSRKESVQWNPATVRNTGGLDIEVQASGRVYDWYEERWRVFPSNTVVGTHSRTFWRYGFCDRAQCLTGHCEDSSTMDAASQKPSFTEKKSLLLLDDTDKSGQFEQGLLIPSGCPALSHLVNFSEGGVIGSLLAMAQQIRFFFPTLFSHRGGATFFHHGQQELAGTAEVNRRRSCYPSESQSRSLYRLNLSTTYSGGSNSFKKAVPAICQNESDSLFQGGWSSDQTEKFPVSHYLDTESSTRGPHYFYFGEMKDGKRHGWGTLANTHRIIHEGEWRDDVAYGWYIIHHEYFIELGYRDLNGTMGAIIVSDETGCILPVPLGSGCRDRADSYDCYGYVNPTVNTAHLGQLKTFMRRATFTECAVDGRRSVSPYTDGTSDRIVQPFLRAHSRCFSSSTPWVHKDENEKTLSQKCSDGTRATGISKPTIPKFVTSALFLHRRTRKALTCDTGRLRDAYQRVGSKVCGGITSCGQHTGQMFSDWTRSASSVEFSRSHVMTEAIDWARNPKVLCHFSQKGTPQSFEAPAVLGGDHGGTWLYHVQGHENQLRKAALAAPGWLRASACAVWSPDQLSFFFLMVGLVDEAKTVLQLRLRGVDIPIITETFLETRFQLAGNSAQRWHRRKFILSVLRCVWRYHQDAFDSALALRTAETLTVSSSFSKNFTLGPCLGSGGYASVYGYNPDRVGVSPLVPDLACKVFWKQKPQHTDTFKTQWKQKRSGDVIWKDTQQVWSLEKQLVSPSLPDSSLSEDVRCLSFVSCKARRKPNGVAFRSPLHLPCRVHQIPIDSLFFPHLWIPPHTLKAAYSLRHYAQTIEKRESTIQPKAEGSSDVLNDWMEEGAHLSCTTENDMPCGLDSSVWPISYVCNRVQQNKLDNRSKRALELLTERERLPKSHWEIHSGEAHGACRSCNSSCVPPCGTDAHHQNQCCSTTAGSSTRREHLNSACSCRCAHEHEKPSQPGLVQRNCFHEAKMLQRVQGHPFVLKGYGILLLGSKGVGIVVERCPMGALDQCVFSNSGDVRYRWSGNSETQQLPNLSRAALLCLFKEVALGMHHVHQTQTLHRDIKLSNIVIGAEGSARICDFGLATPFSPSENPGLLIAYGSIYYTAPEVLRGEGFFPQSDVWSFGVALWEALLREPAYVGLPPGVVMAYVACNSLRLPIPSHLPEKLQSLLQRVLHPVWHKRPSFSVVARDLERVQEDLERTVTTSLSSFFGMSFCQNK